MIDYVFCATLLVWFLVPPPLTIKYEGKVNPNNFFPLWRANFRDGLSCMIIVHEGLDIGSSLRERSKVV